MKSNSKIKLFTASTALAISLQASGSLGNLEVSSFLGQPFFGTIIVDGAEASFLLKNGTVSLSNNNLNAEIRKLDRHHVAINIYSKTLINTSPLTFKVGVGSQVRQYTATINPLKSIKPTAAIPPKTLALNTNTQHTISNTKRQPTVTSQKPSTDKKTIVAKKTAVEKKSSAVIATDSNRPTSQTNRPPADVTQNTSSVISKPTASAQEPIPVQPLAPTHNAIANTYNHTEDSSLFWLIRLVPAGLTIIFILLLLAMLFLLKKRKKTKRTQQKTFKKIITPAANRTANHTVSTENELVNAAVYANTISSQLGTQNSADKIISASQDVFSNLNETENTASEANSQTDQDIELQHIIEFDYVNSTYQTEAINQQATAANTDGAITPASNKPIFATEEATNSIEQNPDKVISVSNELFLVETDTDSISLSEADNQTTVKKADESVFLPPTFGEPFDTPAEEENELANIQITDNSTTVAAEIKAATDSDIAAQNLDEMISVSNELFPVETSDNSTNLSETENIVSEVNSQTTESQINQTTVKETDESVFLPLTFGEPFNIPAIEPQINQTTVEETDELPPLTFGELFDTPAEEENKLVNIQIADNPATETLSFKDEQLLEFYPNNPDDDFSVQPINIKPNTEDNLAPIETTNINLSDTEISDVDRLSFVGETNVQESLASIEQQKINTETFTLPTAEDTDTTPPTNI